MKTREAIIQAGKTRIIPVLLNCTCCYIRIDTIGYWFQYQFITMFADLNPQIFFGGDNAVFWKPLSWTIIFGLIFAFFMTLLIVPAMYLIAERLRRPMRRMYGGKWISMLGIPPLTFVFIPLMFVTMIRHRREVARRRRKLGKDENVNEAFLGSWL